MFDKLPPETIARMLRTFGFDPVAITELIRGILNKVTDLSNAVAETRDQNKTILAQQAQILELLARKLETDK